MLTEAQRIPCARNLATPRAPEKPAWSSEILPFHPHRRHVSRGNFQSATTSGQKAAYAIARLRRLRCNPPISTKATTGRARRMAIATPNGTPAATSLLSTVPAPTVSAPTRSQKPAPVMSSQRRRRSNGFAEATSGMPSVILPSPFGLRAMADSNRFQIVCAPSEFVAPSRAPSGTSGSSMSAPSSSRGCRRRRCRTAARSPEARISGARGGFRGGRLCLRAWIRSSLSR